MNILTLLTVTDKITAYRSWPLQTVSAEYPDYTMFGWQLARGSFSLELFNLGLAN